MHIPLDWRGYLDGTPGIFVNIFQLNEDNHDDYLAMCYLHIGFLLSLFKTIFHKFFPFGSANVRIQLRRWWKQSLCYLLHYLWFVCVSLGYFRRNISSFQWSSRRSEKIAIMNPILLNSHHWVIFAIPWKWVSLLESFECWYITRIPIQSRTKCSKTNGVVCVIQCFLLDLLSGCNLEEEEHDLIWW